MAKHNAPTSWLGERQQSARTLPQPIAAVRAPCTNVQFLEYRGALANRPLQIYRVDIVAKKETLLHLVYGDVRHLRNEALHLPTQISKSGCRWPNQNRIEG